jgi:hypothetical protein
MIPTKDIKEITKQFIEILRENAIRIPNEDMVEIYVTDKIHYYERIMRKDTISLINLRRWVRDFQKFLISRGIN